MNKRIFEKGYEILRDSPLDCKLEYLKCLKNDESFSLVCKMVHHQLLKRYDFPAVSNWWEHVAEKCLENEKVRILNDFDIQVDKQKSHRRPDIVLIE